MPNGLARGAGIGVDSAQVIVAQFVDVGPNEPGRVREGIEQRR